MAGLIPGSDAPPEHPVQVSVSEVGTLRRKLTITIPAERVQATLQSQMSTLQNEAQIPGFRKGRAPMRLIEKRFGSDVRQEVRNNLLAEAYREAMQQTQLDVIGDEDFGDINGIQLPDSGPMTFSVELEIKPEFTLPSLEKIPVKKVKIEVSEEMVERELDRQRSRQGKFVAITDADAAVQEDDLIICGIEMRAGEKSASQPSVTIYARGTAIEGVPVPDLGEKLTGRKIGDTVNVSGTMPGDAKNDFAGQEVQFAITIRQIERFVKPDVDEQMLSNYGFGSVDELKQFLRQRMEVALDDMQRDQMRSQISGWLLENTQVDLPEQLSLRQANSVLVRRMLDLRRQGTPQEEIEKQMDDMRTGAARQANSDLKSFFILEKIARERNVTVHEEEVNSRIAQMASQYNTRFDRAKAELERDGTLPYLQIQIREEKTLDTLLNDAAIEEVETPAAEAAGATAATPS